MVLWLIVWLVTSGTFLTVTGGTIYEFTCHPFGSNPPGAMNSDLVALGLFAIGMMMIFFSIRHYMQNK